MTIKEYIKSHNDKMSLNGLTFQLYATNESYFDHYDINTPIECDIEGIGAISFWERLREAKKEIASLCQDMTREDIVQYFVNNTYDGNSHYWDSNFFFVHTSNLSVNEPFILYGVRLD